MKKKAVTRKAKAARKRTAVKDLSAKAGVKGGLLPAVQSQLPAVQQKVRSVPTDSFSLNFSK